MAKHAVAQMVTQAVVDLGCASLRFPQFRHRPRFQETFIDNGDQDLQAVMDTLVDVGFDGLLVPDHVPVFTLDAAPPLPAGTYRTPFPSAGIAYSVACMRTMLRNSSRHPGA